MQSLWINLCLCSSQANGKLSPIKYQFYSIIWGRCNLKRFRRTVIVLPVYKISSLKITLPKTVQLKTLDFLQQTITMNENVQWQMIKDSVLFALSLGFSVSLFHFDLKKKSMRCIVLYFFFFLVASITLFATHVLFI